jgi:pilus assembly protein Flp/PilA
MLSSDKKIEQGQGLVEYALILVLIAIVVIAALMVLGPKIGNIFSNVNSSLSSVAGGSLPPGSGSDTVCGVYSAQTQCDAQYFICTDPSLSYYSCQ